MWALGRIVGVSTSEPRATWTYAPSRTTEKRSDPHRAQRVLFSSGSPNTDSRSSPSETSSLSRSIPANGLNAEPVEARQFEQWQFTAYLNSSATRYRTAPHSHFPFSNDSPGSGRRNPKRRADSRRPSVPLAPHRRYAPEAYTAARRTSGHLSPCPQDGRARQVLPCPYQALRAISSKATGSAPVECGVSPLRVRPAARRGDTPRDSRAGAARRAAPRGRVRYGRPPSA